MSPTGWDSQLSGFKPFYVLWQSFLQVFLFIGQKLLEIQGKNVLESYVFTRVKYNNVFLNPLRKI